MVSLVVEEDAVVLMVVFQDLERALLGLRACPWGLKIKPTPSEEFAGRWREEHPVLSSSIRRWFRTGVLATSFLQ